MTTAALAIGRAVQQHPFDGKSLAERIAVEITKAYEAGRQSVLDEQASGRAVQGEADWRLI